MSTTMEMRKTNTLSFVSRMSQKSPMLPKMFESAFSDLQRATLDLSTVDTETEAKLVKDLKTPGQIQMSAKRPTFADPMMQQANMLQKNQQKWEEAEKARVQRNEKSVKLLQNSEAMENYFRVHCQLKLKDLVA